MNVFYGFGFNKFKQLSKEESLFLDEPTKLGFESDGDASLWRSTGQLENAPSTYHFSHIGIIWSKIYAIMSGNSKTEKSSGDYEKNVTNKNISSNILEKSFSLISIFANSLFFYNPNSQELYKLVHEKNEASSKTDSSTQEKSNLLKMTCHFFGDGDDTTDNRSNKVVSIHSQQNNTGFYVLKENMSVYKLIDSSNDDDNDNIDSAVNDVMNFERLPIEFNFHKASIKQVSCGMHHTLFLSNLGTCICTIQHQINAQ